MFSRQSLQIRGRLEAVQETWVWDYEEETRIAENSQVERKELQWSCVLPLWTQTIRNDLESRIACRIPSRLLAKSVRKFEANQANWNLYRFLLWKIQTNESPLDIDHVFVELFVNWLRSLLQFLLKKLLHSEMVVICREKILGLENFK